MSVNQKESETERQTYKVNVEQIRKGVVEIEATHLQRAKVLAEMRVKENSEEVQWEEEEIDAPIGTKNERGQQ